MWEPKQLYDEDAWTESYFEQVLASHARLPFPPSEQHIGSVHVAWQEVEPGSFTVHSQGGTLADEMLARDVVIEQLRAYGLTQATYIPFPAERKAAYDDVEAKARKYWTEGAVDVKVNTPTAVEGVVDAVSHGGTGVWEPSFKREDPNSGEITTWHCTCPWQQFAWQRTRKWKPLEGRPCAHVISLYWASMATPVDPEIDPATGQTTAPSGQMGFGGPGFDRTQTPTGVSKPPTSPPAGLPAAPLSIPGISPGTAEAAPVPGPGTIPPFQGYPAPPVPVSVPGGKPPSAENPMQWPGGTFSSVREANYPLEVDEWVRMSADVTFQNSDMVRLKNEEYGIMEGKSQEHGAGQYRVIPKNSIGEVLGVDPTTGWVDVIFPIHDTGPMQPYLTRAWIEPQNLTPMPNVAKPGPFIKRR